MICLMIQSGIYKFEGVLYESEQMEDTANTFKNVTATFNSSKTAPTNETFYLSNNPDEAKLMIATNLALMVGAIHVRNLPFFD